MQLNAARDLKTEIRTNFGPSEVRSGWPTLAIGVAPAPVRGDYRVAVRAAAELPPDALQELRAATAGELDVRITGPVGTQPPLAAVPRSPLAIGASIAHYRCSAGTLGFFARRNRDGVIGIVSNNHVLAVEDGGLDGDEIIHPGPADRGRRPKDVVAYLVGGYPSIRDHGHLVDCAFARLVRGVSFDPVTLGNGRKLQPGSVPPAEQHHVVKLGRTTGLTHGRITAFELDDIGVNYSFGEVLTSGQIEIESVDAQPFSRGGDSGSLICTPEGIPVGLLYARSPFGGSNDSGLSYANRIDAVLDILDVTFVS